MQTLPDMPHSFVIPLTKIDVERRLVIGVAAQEEPDKAREIMDYDSSKAAFQQWSDAAYERSGGLSKGNLRAMHDPKSASGIVHDLTFDDANKRIEVCAKVVDDNDWKKCLAGVYTGFSVGGGYARKWDDPMLKGYKRYTPRLAELSLVDAPCMPSAKFCELVKADGVVEMLELRGRAPEILTFGELMKRQPAPVPTFADLMAARPMTFGELRKADNGNQASSGPSALTLGLGAAAGAAGAAAPAAYHYAAAKRSIAAGRAHAEAVQNAMDDHFAEKNSPTPNLDKIRQSKAAIDAHLEGMATSAEQASKSMKSYHASWGGRALKAVANAARAIR